MECLNHKKILEACEDCIEELKQEIWSIVALMPHARKEELDIIKKKIFD